MHETSTHGQSEDAFVQEIKDQICGCTEVLRVPQAVDNEHLGEVRDQVNKNPFLLRIHVGASHATVILMDRREHRAMGWAALSVHLIHEAS